MNLTRSARNVAKKNLRAKRRVIKNSLFGSLRYEVKSKNARPVIENPKAFEREQALIKRMNSFCSGTEQIELFRGIYYEMRNQLGNLKGKNVFAVSERPGFVRFLREGEGAKVTEFDNMGFGQNSYFQRENLQHLAGQFDCVVSNAVFERHAFTYTDGHTKMGQKPLTQRERSIDSFLPESTRNQLRASENEQSHIAERVAALKNMNLLLKKGGKVILTVISSKTIFKPKEITTTGFRMLQLNHPDPTNYRRITVLEKVR